MAATVMWIQRGALCEDRRETAKETSPISQKIHTKGKKFEISRQMHGDTGEIFSEVWQPGHQMIFAQPPQKCDINFLILMFEHQIDRHFGAVLN